MPDKEGLEMIRELRRRDRGVRIIAMSGGGRVSAADYLQLAAKLGAARLASAQASATAPNDRGHRRSCRHAALHRRGKAWHRGPGVADRQT
jgi:DNA-binding NarL/FixJ family response regulator